MSLFWHFFSIFTPKPDFRVISAVFYLFLMLSTCCSCTDRVEEIKAECQKSPLKLITKPTV